jgi:hypothetical protein
VAWVGDGQHGSTLLAWAPSDLWLGTFSGDASEIVNEDVVAAELLGDHRVVYTRFDNPTEDEPGPASVVVYDPVTREQQRLGGVTGPYAIAGDDEALFMADFLEVAGQSVDRGVWRWPLAGGAPSRVVSPVAGGAEWKYGPVVSSDGRRLARASCSSDAPAAQLQVVVDGTSTALDPAIPIGFSAEGLLITYQDGCEHGDVFTVHVETGERRLLLRGHVDEAVVKPSGSMLAATRLREPLAVELVAIDLWTRDERVWPLLGTAWRVTKLGGDRYVIAEGSPTDEPGHGVWYAIADTVEGWLGYLQLVPP